MGWLSFFIVLISWKFHFVEVFHWYHLTRREIKERWQLLESHLSSCRVAKWNIYPHGKAEWVTTNRQWRAQAAPVSALKTRGSRHTKEVTSQSLKCLHTCQRSPRALALPGKDFGQREGSGAQGAQGAQEWGWRGKGVRRDWQRDGGREMFPIWGKNRPWHYNHTLNTYKNTVHSES